MLAIAPQRSLQKNVSSQKRALPRKRHFVLRTHRDHATPAKPERAKFPEEHILQALLTFFAISAGAFRFYGGSLRPLSAISAV